MTKPNWCNFLKYATRFFSDSGSEEPKATPITDAPAVTEQKESPGMLSEQELAKAMRLNPVWQMKLGGKWPVVTSFTAAGINPEDTGSEDFAQGVAMFQARKGLSVDGIFGPKTCSMVSLLEPLKHDSAHGFIYNGKRVPVVGVNVLDFKETKLAFDRKHGRVSPRKQPPIFGVLHTTGGEGSGHQVWDTLVHRKLSVDVLVDANGDVYQYTDPWHVYTHHGGWTNAYSWGFEMTNDLTPGRGRDRPFIAGTLMGQPHNFEGLLPDQAVAAVKMIIAYCDLFGIPHQIPGRDGKPLDGPAVPLDLVIAFREARKAKRWSKVRQIMTQAEGILRPLYEGCVVGHCMSSLGGKPDPSPDIWTYLMDAGFTIKEIP